MSVSRLVVASCLIILAPHSSGFATCSYTMMRARHPASADLRVRTMRQTSKAAIMVAPNEEKSQPAGRESKGMSEPWATLTKFAYYGAYVSFFGKMVVVIVERINSANMPMP